MWTHKILNLNQTLTCVLAKDQFYTLKLNPKKPKPKPNPTIQL